MSRAVAGAWMAAAMAAGLAACGTVAPASPTDGGADVAALTAQEGCAREAQAICDALDHCAPPWVQYLYGDKTTCVSRLSGSCMDEQGAPGVSRLPAEMASCASAVTAASCADLLGGKYPTACQVKPGTVANGKACGTDWQCADAYCAKPADSNCGVCAPRSTVNGNCAADDGCQPGMVCANKKCVVPGDVGAACDGNDPCRSNLYCTPAGTCSAKLGAGAVCANIFSGECDIYQGFVCSNLITAGQCVQVTVKKGGESCGGGTRTVCMGFNPCSGSTAAQTGVCANPAGDGEACGDGAGAGRNCLPPATCTGGLYRLPSSSSCM